MIQLDFLDYAINDRGKMTKESLYLYLEDNRKALEGQKLSISQASKITGWHRDTVKSCCKKLNINYQNQKGFNCPLGLWNKKLGSFA